LLEIPKAHIVGASMGGMIAQIIAAEYPDRTQSLVSIMSTTGAPHLPQPEAAARDGLLGMADSEGDVEVRLQARGLYPEALPRQLMAIIAAGDRSEQVGRITAPTLVVHGAQDTLLKPRHGEHTHELITGSKFLVYPDMGHNLPSAVVPQIVTAMSSHFAVAVGR
jgi:pimeloyl-ACP methyl ester carboxylesterase